MIQKYGGGLFSGVMWNRDIWGKFSGKGDAEVEDRRNEKRKLIRSAFGSGGVSELDEDGRKFREWILRSRKVRSFSGKRCSYHDYVMKYASK